MALHVFCDGMLVRWIIDFPSGNQINVFTNQQLASDCHLARASIASANLHDINADGGTIQCLECPM